MTDRVQLNLRLDGRRDLLDTIKEVAAPIAKPETISAAPAIPDIEPMLDRLLDNKLDTLLAAKFAGIEERLGNLKA